MPLTQVQLSAALADRAEISRAEAKRVLGAVEEVVLEEWRSWQRAEGADRRSGAVDRSCHAGAEGAHGRNPATGEAVKVAAKPASVDVRTRPLATCAPGTFGFSAGWQIRREGPRQPHRSAQ